MATYRIFPSTSGPGSAAGDTTSYTLGSEFYCTSTAVLLGYYWWCATGADTSSKAFQLWSVTTGTTGSAVSGSAVSSGTLTTGTWNYTALATGVVLTSGQRYRASILGTSGANWYSSTSSGFPSDLVNGLLTCPSTTNATGGIQSGYTVSATQVYPQFSVGSNYWIDVLVSDPPSQPPPVVIGQAVGRAANW